MSQKQEVLIICNTPFQLMAATCIKRAFLMEDDVDLIISDQMQRSDVLSANARKTGLFRTVTHVLNDDYSYYRGKRNQLPTNVFQRAKVYFSRGLRRRQMYQGQTRYDQLFLFNLDRFVVLLYEKLWSVNPRIQVNIYEEGIGSYEHIALPYLSTRGYEESLTPAKRIVDYFFNRPCMYRNIRRMYVFRPELLSEEYPLQIMRIPQISPEDKPLCDALFTIFDYQEDADPYQQDVIFFEECYAQDGSPIDYLAILKPVVDAIGKERLLIKRHPRSRVELFADEGFQTNVNQSIPWEIITLKHPEIADKVWISLCCGSMMCPFYYLGLKPKCVSLLKLSGYRPDETVGAYFDYVQTRLLDPHPEVFFQPQTEEELAEYLRQNLT